MRPIHCCFVKPVTATSAKRADSRSVRAAAGEITMKTVVRQLRKRLMQPGATEDRLPTLLEIAAHQAATFHNADALQAAREAAVIARGRADTLSLASALCTAALSHYQNGDFVSAVALGLDAIDACGAR